MVAFLISKGADLSVRARATDWPTQISNEPRVQYRPTGGLTPLLYGTLKGTFYALLIAVPLALLAALYVSEFMHPRVKAWVKPAVEIMAALPSVVLGFLAGLWLAPLIVLLLLILFPAVVTVPAKWFAG